MLRMDLEGVGAIASACVALIGIAGTIVVGRWALRGAVESANATSRAALDQANLDYRAALDAVRAEAKATQAQWRRGIQREAYAAFLTAIHSHVQMCQRFVQDNADELPEDRLTATRIAIADAYSTARTAQTIIELEGPDEVAEPAAVMMNAAYTKWFYLGKQAEYERAWGRLVRTQSRPEDAIREAAENLMQTLLQIEGTGGLDPIIPNRFPPNVLSDQDILALVQGFRTGQPNGQQRHREANERFTEAEMRFIQAARDELHGRTPA